ncbi:MAG: type III-B CRISPR module-associated protein Cmr5 [bacterium]|jgi:CRISPR-associated protein Cmr5
MPQTLLQKRAAFAYAKVSAISGAGQPREKDFRTRLLDLGTQLHTNGLGQTAAFYKSKADNESGSYRETLAWLREWLADPERRIFENPQGRDLLQLITSSDAEAYRKASVEAKEIALWFKRFAEAMLHSGQGGD